MAEKGRSAFVDLSILSKNQTSTMMHCVTWPTKNIIHSDKRLINAIAANPSQVLSKYLPNIKTTGHNLRLVGAPIGYELQEKDNLHLMSGILYSAL